VRAKFPPDLYTRLRNSGLNNTEIAAVLGVDEASVRRGLKAAAYEAPSRIRELLVELTEILERL